MKRSQSQTQTITNKKHAHDESKDRLTLNTSADDEAENCPSYGSQEYWDERYKKNESTESVTATKTTTTNNEKVSKASTTTGDRKSRQSAKDEEQGSPGFSWYFTYKELRPLLIPLLVGREEDDEEWSDCEEMEEILEGGSDEEIVKDENEESENIDENESENADENESENAKEDANEVVEEEKNTDSDVDEKDTDINEDEVEADNDSETEIANTEEALIESFAAKLKELNTPAKKVLEIGCGDVPLGDGLCKDLLKMNEISKTDPNATIDEIICFDYSKACIDQLVRKQKEESVSEHESKLKVDYKVHDARNLPYGDRTFHLIIDKGTLDAMLSDKIEGRKNCIKIISEASRALAVDGFILIVSHLNANGDEGLAWANDVLSVGLKDGDGASDYHVEVHSNDCHGDDGISENGEMNLDIQEEESAVSDNKEYGPAVYIIQKVKQQGGERDGSSRVDMKFVGY